MPSVAIWDLRVVEGEVLAGTHGRGIWTADLGLTYDNIRLQRPLSVNSEDLALSLYPNPSTGQFRIAGAPDLEVLEVWTISGQLVARFTEGFDQRRSYTVENSKGMHLVRGKAGDRTWTSKLFIQ